MSGAAFASLARPTAAPSHAAPKPSPRLQAKLNISTPGDHFEREADNVADRIMRMPQPGSAPPSPPPNVPYAAPTGGDALVQRACKQCEAEKKSEDSAAEKSTGNSASHGGGDMLIQRVCYEAECESWGDEEEGEEEAADEDNDAVLAPVLDAPPVQQRQQAPPSTVSDMSLAESPRAPSRSVSSGPSDMSMSPLSAATPALTPLTTLDLLLSQHSSESSGSLASLGLSGLSGSQSSGSSSEAPVRARRAREPAAAAAALQDDAEIPVSRENRERAKRRNTVLEDEPAPTSATPVTATESGPAIYGDSGLVRPEDGPPSAKRVVSYAVTQSTPVGRRPAISPRRRSSNSRSAESATPTVASGQRTQRRAAAAAAASTYTPLSNLSPVPTLPSPSPYLSIGSYQYNVTGFGPSFGSGQSGPASSGTTGEITPSLNPLLLSEEEFRRQLLFQRKPRASQPDKPAPLSDVGLPSGGGRPLSGEERGFFEPRLGRDLSSIRLHTDGQAASSADSLNARAFTYGHNVVLNQGEYTPGSDSGRRLLAHELTHAVQQGAAGPALSADAPAISSVSSATVQRMCKATNRSSGSPEQIMIQSYLTKAPGNASVEKEYQVRNSATVKDCFYLDLVDLSTRAIFEIKPRHTPDLGAPQLATYQAAAREQCIGGTQWHIGTQAEFQTLINRSLPASYRNTASASGPWFLPGIRPDEAIEVTSPANGQIEFETIPIEGLPARAIGKLDDTDTRKDILRGMTSDSRGAVLSRLGRKEVEKALKKYAADKLFIGLDTAGVMTGAGSAFVDGPGIKATLAAQPRAELKGALNSLWNDGHQALFTGSWAHTYAGKSNALLAAKLYDIVQAGTGGGNHFRNAMNNFSMPEAKAAMLAAHIEAGLGQPGSVNATEYAAIMATLPASQIGAATGGTMTSITAGATPAAKFKNRAKGMPTISRADAAKKLPASALRGITAIKRTYLQGDPNGEISYTAATSNPNDAGITAEALAGRPVEQQFRDWANGEIAASRAWMWARINATAPAGALKTLAASAQGGNVGDQGKVTDLWKWSLRL